MKVLLSMVLYLVMSPTLAQKPIMLSGKVTNQVTGESLQYVNIYLEGTSYGTVTNQYGEFAFWIPPELGSSFLVISHIGFKHQKIDLLKSSIEYLSISLEPELLKLPELVVQPLDPLEIIYSTIEKIPANYYTLPYTAQSFQREYVKSGGKFIQLLEAVLQTKGTTLSQSSNVLIARYIEDKREKEPVWSSSRGGFYTFGWTEVSGIKQPSQSTFLGIELKKKKDLTKYYEFQLKESIILENKEVYVIEFDQRRKISKSLLKGTLYIDAESSAIVKIDYALSPRGVKFLRPHKTWGGKRLSKPPKKIYVKHDRGEITYKRYGKKWFLNSAVMDTEFDASLLFLGAVLSQKKDLMFHSELVVTAIDTVDTAQTNNLTKISNVGSIPTLQNFIKKEFESYREINDEKWVNNNFIKSDTSISEIAKKLRLNNEQWESNIRKEATEASMSAVFSSKQLRADLSYLQESLEKLHPGLTWYTDKIYLDQKFSFIERSLKNKTTEAEFFQILSPLIDSINCGHTEIYPSSRASKYRDLNRHLFPLELWIGNSGVFVKNDHSQISKGSKLISINGNAISEVIDRLKSHISSDGYNNTYKEFRLNKEFSLLYSQYYQATDTFDVSFKDSSNYIHAIRILSNEGIIESETPDFATFETFDSLSIGVLKIPSFITKQDISTFLENSFQRINSKNINNLIIDLRNNQGGRDDYGNLLYSYLANQHYGYYERITVASVDTIFLNRLSFGELKFKQALPNYTSYIIKKDGYYHYKEHQNLGPQVPQPNSFKGTVYILINGGTFSAASEFAAIAHSKNRAIFIGQEAGGGYYGNCSLGTPLLTLPNSKIRISIPLGRYELAVDQSVPVGHGVIPDYKTAYNLKDVLEGKDKELELSLKIIGEIKN